MGSVIIIIPASAQGHFSCYMWTSWLLRGALSPSTPSRNTHGHERHTMDVYAIDSPWVWGARTQRICTDRELPRSHDDGQVHHLVTAADSVRLRSFKDHTAGGHPPTTLCIGVPGNADRSLKFLLWLKTEKLWSPETLFPMDSVQPTSRVIWGKKMEVCLGRNCGISACKEGEKGLRCQACFWYRLGHSQCTYHPYKCSCINIT